MCIRDRTKAVTVVEESRQTISDFSVYDRVECPFCGAGPEKCQPIGKADTNFVTGFNFWTGCCGFLLLGPFGVSVSYTHLVSLMMEHIQNVPGRCHRAASLQCHLAA